MGDMAELQEERERLARFERFMEGGPLKPGGINPRVVEQSDYWWDIKAEPKLIDAMDLDYVLTVLCFCYEHPALRDSFPGSKLQDKLYNILKDACEDAWKYAELSR